jgi:two-component system sensor histidine kinase ChiS
MKTLPRRPHKLRVASSSVSVPRMQTLLLAFAISLFVIPTRPGTPSVAHAQMDMLRFERISTEQGLSQNTVNAILQDREGFIWFGTEGGLNRYDGYQFTIYQHDPDSPKSLGNDTVFALFEDHAGILWVGTGNGLDRYDPATASFAHYTHDANDPGSLSASFVLAIYQDRAGALWIGTEDGG